MSEGDSGTFRGRAKMAEEEGLGTFTWRLMIAFSLAFAGLLMYSLFDLFFLLLGSEGHATITEAYKLPSRRGNDPVVIEYKFKEPDGFERQGKTNLGPDVLPASAGDEIQIQYLPRWFPAGPDGARPARPFNWTMLGLLLLATLGLGIFSYRAIAASSDTPRKPSRRR